MNKIIIKSFMNIPQVWNSSVSCMYDLRYIFELIYKGYGLETDDIKIYNLHFYIHFYKKIIDCIENDREKTIKNIEKCPYLFTLKQNPKFRTTKNGLNFKWISIVKY